MDYNERINVRDRKDLNCNQFSKVESIALTLIELNV